MLVKKFVRLAWLDTAHCWLLSCCASDALNVVRYVGLAWCSFCMRPFVFAAAIARVRFSLKQCPMCISRRMS